MISRDFASSVITKEIRLVFAAHAGVSRIVNRREQRGKMSSSGHLSDLRAVSKLTASKTTSFTAPPVLDHIAACSMQYARSLM